MFGRLLCHDRADQTSEAGGFCPACRVLMRARDARPELAKPMVAALVVLAVAGMPGRPWPTIRTPWPEWIWGSADRVLRRDLGRDDGGDDVALRDPGGPRVCADGRRAKGWPVATGVLAATYLGVWLMFGVVWLRGLHRHRDALAQSGRGGGTGSGGGRRLLHQPDQTGEPGPLPRAVRAAWAAPFNLMRSAAVAGARYGLSCLGCSAALMVAMVLIGMSSLWWAVILGIVVLVYKLAPPLRMRNELVLSLALAALGVVYVTTAIP